MNGQVRLEVVDDDGRFQRSVPYGNLTVRWRGESMGWIPDRRPGEKWLQAVHVNGTLLARVPLVDDESLTLL